MTRKIPAKRAKRRRAVAAKRSIAKKAAAIKQRDRNRRSWLSWIAADAKD